MCKGVRAVPEPGKEREFYIWKLVAESGVGFEEIHYSGPAGDPIDPGQHYDRGVLFTVPVAVPR